MPGMVYYYPRSPEALYIFYTSKGNFIKKYSLDKREKKFSERAIYVLRSSVVDPE
jgi:hypothetical protein